MTDVAKIERALCEANGCVWDLDPDSDSRQQWRRDVATVLAAFRQPQIDALKIAREALEGMVEYTGKRESWQDNNPQYVTAVRDAIDVINAALKETT